MFEFPILDTESVSWFFYYIDGFNAYDSIEHDHFSKKKEIPKKKAFEALKMMHLKNVNAYDEFFPRKEKDIKLPRLGKREPFISLENYLCRNREYPKLFSNTIDDEKLNRSMHYTIDYINKSRNIAIVSNLVELPFENDFFQGSSKLASRSLVDLSEDGLKPISFDSANIENGSYKTGFVSNSVEYFMNSLSLSANIAKFLCEASDSTHKEPVFEMAMDLYLPDLAKITSYSVDYVDPVAGHIYGSLTIEDDKLNVQNGRLDFITNMKYNFKNDMMDDPLLITEKLNFPITENQKKYLNTIINKLASYQILDPVRNKASNSSTYAKTLSKLYEANQVNMGKNNVSNFEDLFYKSLDNSRSNTISPVLDSCMFYFGNKLFSSDVYSDYLFNSSESDPK